MKLFMLTAAACICFISCNNQTESIIESDTSMSKAKIDTTPEGLRLPPPFHTKSVTNRSKVIGWEKGRMPVAPEGFAVSVFADDLESPRNIYVAQNGDIFVAQSDREGKKGNNILLLRDGNGDGRPDFKTIFLSNLKQPYGILILNNKFYVGNTNGIVQYPYDEKLTRITAQGKTIVNLPTGRHWTRNLIASPSGDKIYIAVGSASNVAEEGMEKEYRRANILEINPDGSGERVYASGLRNPVGMDWAPGTNVLWTAVNERDELGDDLVPDYITSVKEGGFYGWPYSYFGQHEDPRIKEKMKRPELVARAIVPDVALGSHTASLGLVFYDATQFPDEYRNGAFVGQHGSWNRSELTGYKVVFVPFKNGQPGTPQDFLTGFIANTEKSEVYGRPVGVAIAKDGSLLIADDAGNTIWRVSYRLGKIKDKN